MTPNIPPGMKPFDLQEALRDVTKVITRDGREISEMFATSASLPIQTIFAIFKTGGYNPYRVDGRYDKSAESRNDLFLIDDEQEQYVMITHERQILIAPELGKSLVPGKYKLVKID